MPLLFEAAVWMELLADSETVLGIVARVTFLVCALLAVGKLIEQMLSKPTHEETHFWTRKK